MASAGRKKSIVSTAGLPIDSPVANNTLLNQAAITSLYQECSRLRSRLMRIRGFDYYFKIASSEDSRQSTDPVTQLWDLFSLGIPLCYIFDLLPEDEGFKKLDNSEFNEKFEQNPDRAKKHSILMFAMQLTSEAVTRFIPDCEPFTVTELWVRSSNDGLVKVCFSSCSSFLITQLLSRSSKRSRQSSTIYLSVLSRRRLLHRHTFLPMIHSTRFPILICPFHRQALVKLLVPTESVNLSTQSASMYKIWRSCRCVVMSVAYSIPTHVTTRNTLQHFHRIKSLTRIPYIFSSQD